MGYNNSKNSQSPTKGSRFAASSPFPSPVVILSYSNIFFYRCYCHIVHIVMGYRQVRIGSKKSLFFLSHFNVDFTHVSIIHCIVLKLLGIIMKILIIRAYQFVSSIIKHSFSLCYYLLYWLDKIHLFLDYQFLLKSHSPPADLFIYF